ncbi:DNA helicase-2/ATP-dependent DNA helicase PcrA [Alteromonadaceae bacterium 2753L.S.0a.02]|nr:DNA helicase-2/ATP-dependent DNA helicase PcrA [Alteromonadaceae bacterium 2753L.S.0a.02]
MDKRLIFAVAGSGKTSYLISNLDLEKRFLLITYTINNSRNLRRKVIEKFGYIPDNIKVCSYFSFLYSFCFKPFLLMKLGAKGVVFQENPNRRATGNSRYISPKGWIYANRLAKFIEEKKILGDVRSRLEKYYDVLMIDEVQDFGGHDFNFLAQIARSKLDMHFVGDFFQHTFDTSRDANVNKNLHNEFSDYKRNFISMGFDPDEDTLSHSYRCSPSVCKYVQDNLDISIESHRDDITEIYELSGWDDIEPILQDDSIIKLFYQNSKKYPFFSRNWGDCKGEDHYVDVCVVLNDSTLKKFEKNEQASIAGLTKNKLYVALTRTRGRLFIIPEKSIKHLREN